MLQSALAEWFHVPLPEATHEAWSDTQVLAQLLPHLLLKAHVHDLQQLLSKPAAFHGCMQKIIEDVVSHADTMQGAHHAVICQQFCSGQACQKHT